jgi:hypothetical protein
MDIINKNHNEVCENYKKKDIFIGYLKFNKDKLHSIHKIDPYYNKSNLVLAEKHPVVITTDENNDICRVQNFTHSKFKKSHLYTEEFSSIDSNGRARMQYLTVPPKVISSEYIAIKCYFSHKTLTYVIKNEESFSEFIYSVRLEDLVEIISILN